MHRSTEVRYSITSSALANSVAGPVRPVKFVDSHGLGTANKMAQ
jgi:hypothetical protein